MSDLQGTLKEQIIAATEAVKSGRMPWDMPRTGKLTNLPPKRIRPRHKMVVALHMAGWTNVEIANQLGYTDGRVGIILQSQHPALREVRKEMADKVAVATGDIVLRFHQESGKSLDTLIEIRDAAASPVSERRQSALAILDRAGYTPIKKQINLDATVPVQELTGVIDQLDRANEVFVRKSEWEVKTILPATGTHG